MFSFKGNDDFAPIPPPDLNNITMPQNTFSGWVFGVSDWTIGWCPEKCADKNKQTKSSENRVYLNV